MLALAAVAGGPAVAQAAGAAAVFGIAPVEHPAGLAYVVFSARPAETLRGSVIVSNSGDASGRVRLYAVDAATGRTTGAVYLSHSAPRRNVGAWTTLGARTLTLGAGQRRTVAFRVRIPPSATPGQHLGGIVAENLKLKAGPTGNRRGTSFHIKIRSLSIVAVQVNVPGKRVEKLALTGVAPGAQQGFQTLLVGMHNTGNQLLKGTGTLAVRGRSGAPSKTVTFGVDTFLPTSAVSDPVALGGRELPAGTYDANVVVRYGHGRLARLSSTFTLSRAQIKQVFGTPTDGAPAAGKSSVPLALLIAGGAALFAAGAGLSRVRRRHT